MKLITLTQGKFAKVDDEDNVWLSTKKWFAHYNHISGIWYARRESGTVHMHREIMKPLDEHDVDHINGDGLDNQRHNLRCVSHADNCRNSGPRGKKRYKGIYLLPSGRWAVKVWIAPKLIHIGVCDTEFEAAIVYDQAVVTMLGSAVYTNFGR